MDDAFEVIGARLLAHAADTLAAWLPKGRRQGREWCVGSLTGEPGQSLKINIDSGKWQDFSTGQKGTDLISLYAQMRGISQGAALKELGGEDLNPVPVRRANGHAAEAEPEPLIPPPPDAPLTPQTFRHVKHGLPAHVYLYRDAAGEVLYAVARYESAAGKQFCPFSWDGERWRAKAPPKPRPLYGLDRLARLDRRVVVVEGEKAAEALQAHVTRSPVMTWSGGASNWKYADWEPLRGRSVLLWPDADSPGVVAAQGIAALLLGLGCALERIDVEGLPDGFDAADLVAQGVGGADISAWLKPRMRSIQPAPEPAPAAAPPAPVEPQRVLAPGPVPGRPAGALPGYALAEKHRLAMGRQGIVNSAGNVGRLVEGIMDSAEVSPVWWDQFLQRRMTEGGEWKDEDDDRLVMYINSQMELHNITADNVRRAAAVYAVSHPRDCAADWLRSLRWDGLTRCARLLVDGFGARDSEYTQAVGRCFVMGMVARVLSPGCQLDNLPVFEGPQGVKKSKALRRLGGEWHAEVHEDIHNKDFYLALAGKMLVEISEFQSFKRGDIEMVKAVISRPTDRYRVPFARSAGDHPRRCAFAATTNNYRWNIDPTGARRFWPVRCGVIEVEWIEASREQLFAEAVALYDRGMPWWDVPEELAGQEQRARYNLDSIEIPLKRYLAGHTFVTLPNIMEMGLGLEKNQRYDTVLTSRVLSLLTRWGWRESTYTDPDSRQTWDGFSPPEPAAAAPAAHRAKS